MAESCDDVIVLDLLQFSETCKLNEQRTDEYLYISAAKSDYHFEVRPLLRLYGQGGFEADGIKDNASVLVFSIQAKPKKQTRPIRWASFQITFEKDEGGPRPQDAPRIVTAAPGLPPLFIDCTPETQNIKDSKEISGNISGGAAGGSAGSNVKKTKERNIQKEKSYATRVDVWIVLLRATRTRIHPMRLNGYFKATPARTLRSRLN